MPRLRTGVTESAKPEMSTFTGTVDNCNSNFSKLKYIFLIRLVSEMTVEENILKKANQKRLLGDLAIEGGNFTTAYFKNVT
jgi:hypothetical protein